MIKSKNHQAGFGAIATIALLLVAVVLSGTGFIVYKRQNNEDNKKSSTSNPAVPPQSVANGTQSMSNAVTPTLLTMKEWGIQLQLPDTIKDAYYVPSSTGIDPDGTPNAILLGSKTLDALGCKAADGDNGKQPLAQMLRTAPGETDPVHDKLYIEEFPDGITIGGYYYAYQSWATTNKCAPASSLKALDDGMKAAIKTASATSNAQTSAATN